MDLHAPAPSSSASASGDDGIYDLAEPVPPPAPAPPPPVDPGTTPAPAPTPASAAPEAAKANGKAAGGGEKAKAAVKKKRKRRRSRKFDLPSWAVSLIVHVAVLMGLAASTFTEEGRKAIADLSTALVSAPEKGAASEELTPIYADPTNNARSNEAVGNENADKAGGGGGFSGVGTGPPTATPVVAGAGTGVSEKTSLPGVHVALNTSGLSLTPAAPGLNLGGTGMIAGDVTYEAKDVGASLDQIAREILRHLTQHKLTVIWLFDESSSMKDDQQAIKQKFDRIVSELKTHADSAKKATEPLTHTIVGFGEDIHYVLEKPTSDIERIGSAIDKLRVDDSGIENTLHAINEVIGHYSGLIKRDRKLLIVLVTDESGDDGGYIEEAHQAVVSKNVPVYVIGRQSLFGAERAHLEYRDPVTKDIYWPWIRRGPETAGVELLQWDGLHDRWDEQPSGFAPYELARISKDSGGIYFLLPSEENMRVRTREKAYRIADLKEYMPDYKSRMAYIADRNKSELRRTMYEIIQATTWNYGQEQDQERMFYRRHFPINPEEMIPAANKAGVLSTERLNVLLAIQKKLESIEKLRDREPEKRWQANYDLMLAQVVAYQVKSYEYRALMEEMIKNPPHPKLMPNPNLMVQWEINHSQDRKAPKERTEKKYLEATRLLKEVIAKHPKTPWADLAQDTLNRGLGVRRDEWRHSPQYQQRAKMVPKY
jgi:hypothetical protein